MPPAQTSSPTHYSTFWPIKVAHESTRDFLQPEDTPFYMKTFWSTCWLGSWRHSLVFIFSPSRSGKDPLTRYGSTIWWIWDVWFIIPLSSATQKDRSGVWFLPGFRQNWIKTVKLWKDLEKKVFTIKSLPKGTYVMQPPCQPFHTHPIPCIHANSNPCLIHACLISHPS